jgi:Ca2+-binding RTX toxin-like protein
MAIPTDNTVPLTGEPFIDGLTLGCSWVFPGSRVLTYSFSIYDDPAFQRAWDAAWQDGFAQAFQAWANVANISFRQSGSGTLLSQSPADHALALATDLSYYQIVSAAIPPSPGAIDPSVRPYYPRPEGDIFVDPTWPFFGTFAPGSFGRELLIHEIGHALGLKHPFDDGGAGRPTFEELGIAEYDTQVWTVMSYTHGPNGDTSFGHAATPMPLDILAIQHVYGPNMSYRTGNDVYALSDNGVKWTIWDAGGTDTIDASRLPEGIELTLTGGAFLDYGARGSRTAIAFNVTIENAIGTGFHDHLVGNDANNVLRGGGADDFLAGGLGNDTYDTDGHDTILENPGEGVDTVRGPVVIRLGANLDNLVLTGTAALSGYGNELDNRLTGNTGANVLDGDGGADTMEGLAGNDRYVVDSPADIVREAAGAGRDTIDTYVTFTISANVEVLRLVGTHPVSGFGDTFDNELDGAANPSGNLLVGFAGNDTYELGSGDAVVEQPGEGIDTVRVYADYALPDDLENLVLLGTALVGEGNDVPNAITGTAGPNILDGGRSVDDLNGLAGGDTYRVDSALDRVIEALAAGSDEIESLVSLTLPANVENGTAAAGTSVVALTGNSLVNILTGNNGANVLDGMAGNDQLLGNGGHDTLLGGDGGDQLVGGDGLDILLGGAGRDRFRFDVAPDGGNVDRIMDFVSGADYLEFSATEFAALGAAGDSLDGKFVKGPGAQALDSDDYLFYDTSTGRLYYDADGSDTGAPDLVATLQGAPNVAVSDLLVV